MKTRSIKQTVIFPAPASRVFELMLSSKAITLIHGAKATISRKPDGRISYFDGYISGYHIAIEKGKRIEQACHFKEEGWPDDHFSICTFTFKETSSGTKMDFVQKGVPESKIRSLSDGWIVYFWYPMLQYLLK